MWCLNRLCRESSSTRRKEIHIRGLAPFSLVSRVKRGACLLRCITNRVGRDSRPIRAVASESEGGVLTVGGIGCGDRYRGRACRRGGSGVALFRMRSGGVLDARIAIALGHPRPRSVKNQRPSQRKKGTQSSGAAMKKSTGLREMEKGWETMCQNADRGFAVHKFMAQKKQKQKNLKRR